MNKRGLSAVITSVLIILIVLAAVLILWFFLKPLFISTGERTSNVGECLGIDLEIIKCDFDSANNAYEITVKRNAGEGDLQGIRIVFTGDSGTDTYDPEEVSLPVLDSQTFTSVVAEDLGDNVEVNVAALIGEELVSCNPQGKSFSCS